MKSTRCAVALAAAALLSLAACGGPVTSDPLPPSEHAGDRDVALPRPSRVLLETAHAIQAPVVEIGGRTHIGLDIAPRIGTDTYLATARGVDLHRVSTSYIDLDYLRRYLQHDYERAVIRGISSNGQIRRFLPTPPVVYLADGADNIHTSAAVRAVQIVNAALPTSWQITFSTETRTNPQKGEILIEFSPRETWPDGREDSTLGVADVAVNRNGQSEDGHIRVDHTRLSTDDYLLGVIVHELLHVLGREHPKEGAFPNSIMNAGGEPAPGHILHPLDREALNTIYLIVDLERRTGEIDMDADHFFYQELGVWSGETAQFVGAFDLPNGEGRFGVALDISGNRAWAYGPTPLSDLSANRALSGTVTWGGKMVGMLELGVIGSDVDLSVDLIRLDGDLDFMSTQHLIPVPSQNIASGDQWGDGDLHYDVAIRGNTFIQTGGDEGIITGAFFGNSHEGMGGTLEHSDLTAGFGGTRQ